MVRKKPNHIYLTPNYRYIIAALRRIWLWDTERKLAKQEAGGKCAKCGKSFDKLEMDHINGIRYDSWDNCIADFFVRKKYIQALCHEDHLAKTREERTRRSHERKRKS